MDPTAIALTSVGVVFAGTLIGLILNRLLPEHHLGAESRDAIKVGAGMVSMMSALVLGLLVSSAKNNFESTSDAITQGSAKIIMMDRLLAAYGDETKEIRQNLRLGVAGMIELLWPQKGGRQDMVAFENASPMEKFLAAVRELKPKTEAQAALRSKVLEIGNELLLSRWLQIEQAQTPLPPALLVILLFWLTALFMSFGLLAPRNATVVVVLFVGALSVASAIFLILELDRPMNGLIKVSKAPMVKALEHLSR